MMIKLYGYQEKRCRENNKGGMITSRFVCMVNLNCILAIFPEWGQKAPPHIINKGFKGKVPC
mgnify:CR=1 FL=1